MVWFINMKETIITRHDNMEIIIDTREYNNQQYLISLFSEDFSLVNKELLVGDYLCGKIIFEHKTATNLIQDLFTGHLLQQSLDLAYNKLFGFVPTIVMSCNITDLIKYDTSLTEEFLLGTLSSISYHYGIQVLFLGNERMLVNYMQHSFIKGNEIKLPTVSPVRKPITTENLVVNHYATIPDVGFEVSKNLAEKFPVPAMLYSATKKEMQEVPLIGKKRADEIYTFLHGSG